MSAGSWAGNPYNKENSLKQHALPGILFGECHKNCVEFEMGAAANEGEVLCIKNCQEKTYQAFDMYMRVQYNFEQKRGIRDFVDVSKYTGMEVEHGNNTANLHHMNNASNLGHFDPNSTLQGTYKKQQREINSDSFLSKLRTFANTH